MRATVFVCYSNHRVFTISEDWAVGDNDCSNERHMELSTRTLIEEELKEKVDTPSRIHSVALEKKKRCKVSHCYGGLDWLPNAEEA